MLRRASTATIDRLRLIGLARQELPPAINDASLDLSGMFRKGVS
jgi:hypothetical protein